MRWVVNHREQQIFDLLCRHGELSILEISQHLGISASSVRRDLVELDNHPFIQRTRGGAALSNIIRYDAVPVYRLPVEIEEVRSIARTARALIQPGDVIGLSGGRLCTELALHLRLMEGIAVVTNAVNVAAELAALAGVRVMLTGGELDRFSFELVGQALRSSLEGVRIHKFFVGTDGLSVDQGISNHSEAEALAARELVHHADQTIVLADNSKFRRPHLAQVVPLSEVTTIITTERTPSEVLRPFQEAGVQFIIAPCPECRQP